MQDCTPHVDPANELQIIRGVRLAFYDVEDGFVEYRDWAGYSSDAKRLGSKEGKDERGHEGG